MDEQAFFPVRSEELAPNMGIRILQYQKLVEELKDRLVIEKLIQEYTTSGTRIGIHIRYTYTLTGKYLLNLQFNIFHWEKYAETPLWLGIKKPTQPYSSFSAEAKQKLSSLEFEEPARLFQENDELLVPLFIPEGAEKDAVLNSLAKQVKEIADRLSK